MALIDLLTASDVEVLFGDTNGHLVDIAAANVIDRMELAGGGQTQVLRPVRSTDPIVTPTQTTRNATADLYDSDTTDSLSTVDRGDSTLAVMLTLSGRGWLIPSDLLDLPATDASRRYDVSDIVRISAMFDTTGTVMAIMSIAPIRGDGNLQVQVPASGEVWAILTTAGSVGGNNLGVGIHDLNSSAGAQRIAGGARGWLVAAVRE